MRCLDQCSDHPHGFASMDYCRAEQLGRWLLRAITILITDLYVLLLHSLTTVLPIGLGQSRRKCRILRLTTLMPASTRLLQSSFTSRPVPTPSCSASVDVQHPSCMQYTPTCKNMLAVCGIQTSLSLHRDTLPCTPVSSLVVKISFQFFATEIPEEG